MAAQASARVLLALSAASLRRTLFSPITSLWRNVPHYNRPMRNSRRAAVCRCSQLFAWSNSRNGSRLSCCSFAGPSFAVGVSIRLAPVGPSIHTLAFATQDQVFCLSFQQPPSPAQKETLRKLLIVQNVQYLTGFELPYTITLLTHTLGSDISGYDLSTLKSGHITTPGDFLHWKNASISPRRINELWDGVVLGRSDANSTGKPEPNYALRAWFTAMCVTPTPPSFFDHPTPL
jgi:hypothetical protein